MSACRRSGGRHLGEHSLPLIDHRLEASRKSTSDLGDQAQAVEAERDRHRCRALPDGQIDVSPLGDDASPRLADLPAEELESVAEAADPRAGSSLEGLVIAVEAHGPSAPREELVAWVR